MRIWRDQTELPTQELCELECWRTYTLEVERPERLPAGVVKRRLPHDGSDARVEVDFGDYIGRIEIEGAEFVVRSGKLDEYGFEELLQQITMRVSQLPFDFNTPTFVPFTRDAFEKREFVYHAFLYLRWAVRHAPVPLSQAWASIAADPHRTLIRQDCEVPIWDARTLSARTIDSILANPSTWVPVDGVLADAPLAQHLAFDGTPRLPEYVRESRAKSSFDTPENRFVKHALDVFMNVCGAAHRLFLETDVAYEKQLAEDAADLLRTFRTMASAEFLNEVGTLRHFPAQSQVLQKRFGYRDMLTHHLAVLMAARYPIDAADLKRIVETKSGSTLYEYWTFFEVAELLQEPFGRPKNLADAYGLTGNDQRRASLKEGVPLAYGEDVHLWYNRAFGGNRKGSYSVPLRPDITLRLGDRFHLFDAKFRVERFGAASEDVASAELEAEEQADRTGTMPQGWVKHADIHKMHTYKDALRARAGAGADVATVWVLYPGTEFVFYDEELGRVQRVEDLPPEPRGIGAIPMMPRGGSALLREVLGILTQG